jgi:hypothetical protein
MPGTSAGQMRDTSGSPLMGLENALLSVVEWSDGITKIITVPPQLSGNNLSVFVGDFSVIWMVT